MSEVGEPTTVGVAKYFCPGSCQDLAAEQPRDTGDKYFIPGRADDDDEDSVDQLITPSQTGQQQDDTDVAPTQLTKPQPGTGYSISETCLSGSDELVTLSRVSLNARVFNPHRRYTAKLNGS